MHNLICGFSRYVRVMERAKPFRAEQAPNVLQASMPVQATMEDGPLADLTAGENTIVFGQ